MYKNQRLFYNHFRVLRGTLRDTKESFTVENEKRIWKSGGIKHNRTSSLYDI